MNRLIPNLCSDDNCTGCMACANSCNKNAISIVQNSEGFYRPVIDEKTCVACGLCLKVCPILTPSNEYNSPIKVFAGWHLDSEIRMNSSSGGIFSAMAESVLEQGGIVVGASYNNNMKIEHCAVETKEQLNKLRLSKYAQSEIGFIYKDIKEALKEGRRVLFCGTPCQVAGLRKFLVKDYEHLILCDFICHGVPSIKMLHKYLEWLEHRYGEIKHINFRDKRKGWYDALRVVTLKNSKKVVMRGKKDAYWVGFNNNNNNMQESCYKCKFVGLKRNSDITIADYWGVGKKIPFGYKDDIERGVSCIIANSRKGLKILTESENKIKLIERNLEEVLEGNQTMLRPCARPASRNTIYSDVDKLCYEDFRQKYLDPPFKNKLIKLWREYLPYFIIKYVRTKNQK